MAMSADERARLVGEWAKGLADVFERLDEALGSIEARVTALEKRADGHKRYIEVSEEEGMGDGK
jgi:hypothetical protein